MPKTTETGFNPHKKLKSMRLTPDEEREFFLALMDKVSPPEIEDVQFETIFDLYDEAMDVVNNGDKMVGLSTGYPSVDLMTMGLNEGDIIVIYGYTSMGKSQLTQNITLNIAKAGTPVLFIGLELTNKQNAARLLKMDPERESGAALPIIFPQTPELNIGTLSALVKRAKKEAPIGLVVVDQLQDLLRENTQEEITSVMSELKRVAIVHKLPIIVVSHVNRQGASQGPPPLEVLKGSSSIEQKTDIALAVYRDHEAEPGDKLYGKMAIALRKNRQRGMNFRHIDLDVDQNMRLIENPVDAVFPGAVGVR